MRSSAFLLLVVFALPRFAHAATVVDGAMCRPELEPHLAGISDAVSQAIEIAHAEPECAGRPGLKPSSRQLHVPPSIQDNPTCAFHALRMVSMYWIREKGAQNAKEVVVDEKRPGSALTMAKQQGLTKSGSINYQGLKRVAEYEGYQADLAIRSISIKDVRKEINAGNPVIAHFIMDYGDGGLPSTKRLPDRSHACVIEGFCLDRWGREFVILKHPWRNEPYAVPLGRFLKSWKLDGQETIVVRPMEKLP